MTDAPETLAFTDTQLRYVLVAKALEKLVYDEEVDPAARMDAAAALQDLASESKEPRVVAEDFASRETLPLRWRDPFLFMGHWLAGPPIATWEDLTSVFDAAHVIGPDSTAITLQSHRHLFPLLPDGRLTLPGFQLSVPMEDRADLVFYIAETARAHFDAGHYEAAMRTFPPDFLDAVWAGFGETNVFELGHALMTFGRLLEIFEPSVSRPESPEPKIIELLAGFQGQMDAVVNSQRRQERLMLESRARDVRLADELQSLRREIDGQSTILLAVPNDTAMQIREDWRTDEEFASAREALIRQWQEDSDSIRRSWPEQEAERLLGRAAWGSLQNESRHDVILAFLLERDFAAVVSSGAACAWALCKAMERELRAALVRSAGFAEHELMGGNLGNLIELTPRAGGRVAASAVRLEELRRLRNKATHPAAFANKDLDAVRRLVFADGDYQVGLLAVISTYKR